MKTTLLATAGLALFLCFPITSGADAQMRIIPHLTVSQQASADEGLSVDADADGAAATPTRSLNRLEAARAARGSAAAPGDDGLDTDSDGVAQTAAQPRNRLQAPRTALRRVGIESEELDVQANPEESAASFAKYEGIDGEAAESSRTIQTEILSMDVAATTPERRRSNRRN